MKRKARHLFGGLFTYYIPLFTLLKKTCKKVSQMSDHYYSKHPQSKEHTETNEYVLNGRAYTFTTGAGVFSKKGIDFGSRLLIETFVEPDVKGNILDLGCGYGPIGLSLANQFKTRKITMVDINERAVLYAKKNAQTNQIENVQIVESDQFTNIDDQQFAAVVTNPPIRAGKKVIQAMFEKSHSHLMDHGELWVVVQKKQGAPSVITFLESVFTNVEVVTRKKGYYIIRAVK